MRAIWIVSRFDRNVGDISTWAFPGERSLSEWLGDTLETWAKDGSCGLDACEIARLIDPRDIAGSFLQISNDRTDEWWAIHRHLVAPRECE